MPSTNVSHPHETLPVGKTEEDQKRNAELLAGYDYEKYNEALTGFTGQDLQRVGFIRWEPAVRTRIGSRGNYKSGFAMLSSGKLVTATCRDTHEPDPAKQQWLISIYESSDLGLTWQEIGQTPLYHKEPSLAVAGDGTLVLFAENGDFRPGVDRRFHLMARSQDGGRIWDVSTYKAQSSPRNIITEADGSLLFVTAVKSDFHDKGGGSTNLLLHRSQDAGKTWATSEGEIDWDWTGFGEVAVIRFQDGRLLAALRRRIPHTLYEGYEDTVVTESTDDGKTWAKPWQLLSTAKVHAYLTKLYDGRILCTYSNYHVPFGVSAVISADGGKTWDEDHTIRLSTSNGYYVGWAVTLQLPDQSLITSYAATTYPEQEPDKFTAEVVRWKLPR